MRSSVTAPGGCSRRRCRPGVAAYVDAHVDQLDPDRYRLVVRNGHHAEREGATAAGAVAVRQSRINDKCIDPDSGQRVQFSSNILPGWARSRRRSPRCCLCTGKPASGHAVKLCEARPTVARDRITL